MKGRSKTCHVLAAAGKEESIVLLRQILRGVSGSGQLRIRQAATLEQIRRGVSGEGAQSPADLLIAVMPLSDGTGVEGIIDVAQRHPQLMTVLLVRQEAFEQVTYQCRNQQIFVIAMPFKRQVLAEAASFMLRIGTAMADKDKELARLRKNLSEVRTITRAKIRLIQTRQMTEEEAHYYLEKEAMDSFETELMLGRAGIVLNILAICFVVWLTSSLGINPIVQAVDQIKSDSPIQETGAEEFRYLARAYNNLYAVYRNSIEHLNFKASHDELTGAYNRAGFDLLLSSLDLNSAFLMLFDVDNFKSINDTYGHDTGDKALQKLVQVLKGSFRSDDYVCRIGGDEFAVFMVHSSAMQQKLIGIKMEQINRELADTEDGLPPFSVSVGIVHGSQAENAESLLKKGDQALYESKKRGKHTHTFYEK